MNLPIVSSAALSTAIWCGAVLAFSGGGVFAQGGDSDAGKEAPSAYTVQTGTRIPLGLINSVSTKHSAAGDRIYLETVFPIVIDSHIVIPPGSYVTGTVTDVKRPGRVKGRGELYVRFDSITLPNGVTREFRSRLGSVDARGDERLDKKEGQVQADSNKGGDAKIIGEGAATGAGLGAIVGSTAGHAGMGAGVGAAAGAAAGIAGVLLTRGPDAVLAKGSTIEMVLDRPLIFAAGEVNFTSTGGAGHFSDGGGPVPENKAGSAANPGRRLPF
jgi:type IV secretion system protein VirB10